MIPIQDLISTGLFNLCRCQGLETCRVYPWTQQFVNTISGHDVTRASSFPDLDPSSLPRNAQFSMAAGDFLEVSNSFPILSFKGNSIIYHLIVDCWMRSTCIHFALPCIWFLCAQCHILVFFFFLLKVYTDANTWDCVATCFFIDCANNIVSFIETIHKILKSGKLLLHCSIFLQHLLSKSDTLVT